MPLLLKLHQLIVPNQHLVPLRVPQAFDVASIKVRRVPSDQTRQRAQRTCRDGGLSMQAGMTEPRPPAVQGEQVQDQL